MPHKFNADRRDKIPKQKQRVTNWAEYNECLRRRALHTESITTYVPLHGLLTGRAAHLTYITSRQTSAASRSANL